MLCSKHSTFWTYIACGLFLWQFHIISTRAQSCTKFASDINRQAAVAVSGVCYYGFGNSEQYEAARAHCELEGTHLVHLQTAAKQQAVFNAIGSNFGQHWMGLRYMNTKWVWYYSSTSIVDATADVTGRWYSSSTGECGYTVNSNQVIIQPALLTEWYRAVCEDSAAPVSTQTTSTTQTPPTTTQTTSTTQTPPTTTQTTSTTQTTPTTTTTTPPPPSTEMISAGLFYKQSTLTTVQLLFQTSARSLLGCARQCRAASACRHFVFLRTSKACQLLEENSAAAATYSCSGEEVCYSKK